MTKQTTDEKQISSNVLLEQYKLYVEMADRVSARRIEINKFYTSILAGLLAVVSVVVEKNVFSGFQDIVFVAVSLLGILLCAIWIVNIHSFRQLNSMKFKIIHEMESNLPFRCYEREWEILQNKKRKYLRATLVEQLVPAFLSIPFIALFLYAILK